MSLTPGARRADSFAALLETGRRTDDLTMTPYVALADALRTMPVPAGPRPEFSTNLRQRLVAVAAVQGVGSQPAATERMREIGSSWRFQRRVAAVAGAAAAATAIAGVGVGASRSLPGDAFYGVKRASEQVQLAVTFGTEAKGERHLEFARTRLAEVQALAAEPAAIGPAVPGHATALGSAPNEDRTQLIIDTLADMDSETRAGQQDLLSVYRSTASTAPLTTLNVFTQEQFTDLRALAPVLPAEAQAQVKSSLRLLDVVAAHTVALAKTAAHNTTGGGHNDRHGKGSGGPNAGHNNGTGSHPTRTSSPSSSPTSTPSGSGTKTSYPPPPAPLPSNLVQVPPLPDSSTTPTLDPNQILPTDVPTVPTELPTLGDILG